MKFLTSTDAMNRFGKLLDMAQAEPVLVQRRGRDVAVVVSPEEFRRLTDAASGKISPAQKLHAESARGWAKVYEALAGQRPSLLPLREKVDRPQVETDEGCWTE